MDSFYIVLFGALAIGATYMEYSNHRKSATTESKLFNFSSSFLTFRNNYIVVYSLMMAGDWLQGPYVYALYSYYGYSKGDIGRLFIAGFGSSLIVGTFVGSLADKVGRKKIALVYCATYIASCVTKHWSNYHVLMLGRFFGGIATSLLFSVFESWLVAEHFSRGFEASWLGSTFSKAVFYGNGLVAIAAGVLANYLVRDMDFGPVAPFDAAIVFLTLGAGLITFTWNENHGDKTENNQQTFSASFQVAVDEIRNDTKIFLLGCMQALFEGAMYTFVFLWTPALAPTNEDIPHGFIFSTMMVACMLGSAYAGRLLAEEHKPEVYMKSVFGVSAAAMIVPVLAPFLLGSMALGNPRGLTVSGFGQLLAFCVFEMCVGMFWPSFMQMRSKYVPEEHRSTIINIFRIPLNLFVCTILYNVDAFETSSLFFMCFAFLVGAMLCMIKFENMTTVNAIV
ncbi:hypothetical protein SARC_01008 [Sphaeroforma arctica JP610]|uniref:Molybdate-anion transporter n=1 Tax=Sphaeroforma arctica JP610 TaxID=667725 RepID=A0A0L0GCW6_9EUKA|nr:hypothetical protein SARC_01008 [Sphaeroforma arctica JP610]KNC86862.1 hypothetical protein SARC_01008 [Sphaeroforma arctica JP610]|eukprot:XP_014160764.1 hypothetical protein SARC_01008 [Sphaeroforma arctica JP610]